MNFNTAFSVCRLLIKLQISLSCRFSMLQLWKGIKAGKCYKVRSATLWSCPEVHLSGYLFSDLESICYISYQFFLSGYSAHKVLITMPTAPCTQWLVGPLSLFHEADHSYSCSEEWMEMYLPFLICLDDMVLACHLYLYSNHVTSWITSFF